MAAVTRRLHTPALSVGDIVLDPGQARHARDVLRLEDGTPVELFDDSGAVATGTLLLGDAADVRVRVAHVERPDEIPGIRVTVASAVPKGERADWMVEKLSEIGVAAFIPLVTDRSVVKPEGRNKYDRWARIATESAKQSRRSGVMRIGELATVRDLTAHPSGLMFYFSTLPDARPLAHIATRATGSITLLVGPEGGWTAAEVEHFAAARVTPLKLTPSVLRVETAAVVGAAAVLLLVQGAEERQLPGAQI